MGLLRIIHRQVFLYLDENIYCNPSLEPSQRDGSNDESQNMFFGKNLDNYPKIIPVIPSFVERCC